MTGGADRVPIVRIGVLAVAPLATAVAVFLLFAGHNRPGGGFAAGLVLGAVVALRTVAGLPRLVSATTLLGVGGAFVGLVALAPVLWGDTALDQVVASVDLPVLGTVKSGTALLFDIGVLAIVVGLVTAVIDGLDLGQLAEGADELTTGGDGPDPTGEVRS